MASNSNFEAKVLMLKGKRAAAAYVHADCSKRGNSDHLNEVLDNLLNPAKAIDEWETIDWCKWLMAGGRTPDEFSNIVRTFDNATTCGLVWTPNFVAYRCRTCGISPCMSLCTDCFKKGNHHRHDFNMFLSQAGGACDCGDTSVMKESGFCDRHGPNKMTSKYAAPADLMCVAQAMMPRIILRLIQHLREISTKEVLSNGNVLYSYTFAIHDTDAFVTMLMDFNNMGGLMRRVMTQALTNPQMYRILNEIPESAESEYAQYMTESKRLYNEAVQEFANPEPIDEFKDCPGLQRYVTHNTFLEELVFWIVKYEFPQKIVCLLLNMLPDLDYKECFTNAFVSHYSRIPLMLEHVVDPDTVSNRIVHVSVQLFSNESLALRMAEQHNLLLIIIVSLKYMMSKTLVQNTLHDPNNNFHYVVNCGAHLLKDHCYWPLVSDLNNILSHRPVALQFMGDDLLLEIWFTFISMYQGMNVNEKLLKEHVEYEPNSYYAAFSSELEGISYPMWAMVSHLLDSSTVSYSRRVLSACLSSILEWFDAINFTSVNMVDRGEVSFHLPLHRHFAVFLSQAVSEQGLTLNEILPDPDVLTLLIMHPLRINVAFYEILNEIWVRNGLQIRGQALTYIQCNFSNSMVDADFYLMQVCATRIPSDTFLNILIDKFHLKEWTSLEYYHESQKSHMDGEHDTPMLEGFLTFLATLVCLRTNLGLSDIELNRLEMVTLLCMGDKTHSQLMETIPDRCGTFPCRDFEFLLDELATYKPPYFDNSGNMQQGTYTPKDVVWEKFYDPLYVMLRAVQRRDIHISMERFSEYYGAKKGIKITPERSLWPPYRAPTKCNPAYDDPRMLLQSRVFHSFAFIVLYNSVQGHASDQALALIIFLLEMAVVTCTSQDDESSKMCTTSKNHPHAVISDTELSTWFTSDSLIDNFKTEIGSVVLTPVPEVSPATYSSDSSDVEWESSEADNEMTTLLSEMPDNVLMLEEANWSSLTQSGDNNSMAIVPHLRSQESLTYQELALPDSESQASSTALALPSSSEVINPSSSMAIAIPQDMSIVRTRSVESVTMERQPALPSTTQHPAVLAGNEVGRPSLWTPSNSDNSYGAVMPSTSTHRKLFVYKRRPVEGTHSNPPTVKVNESILSLLLKIHSNLSGTDDSYNPDDSEAGTSSGDVDESYVVEGPAVVARLLKKICSLDRTCCDYIQETRNKLWPPKSETENQKIKETRDKEERRRKAKERQEKLMAEFASKQKEFMEKMETDENISNMDWANEEVVNNKQQGYDCVICNQNSCSTEDKPMGLAVLVQGTSVAGFQRRHGDPAVLPTTDEEKDAFRNDDTLIYEFEKRVEELSRHFDPHSWLLSINLGWDGGVFVQTCGHHLHLDCLKAYQQSLLQSSINLNSSRTQLFSPEKGEYLCPLCRQLCNSVLPLSPKLGELSQIVRSEPTGMTEILQELNDFLKENKQAPSTSKLSESMGKAMEDMTSATKLKPIFKWKSDKPSYQTLFLFVTSIARVNLEVELIQKGGNLVSIKNELEKNFPLTKRNCIVPLLHVLALHARVLASWPASITFQQLCGLRAPSSSAQAIAAVEKEVPLLIRDPMALLLQFVLLLPLQLDQTYFTTVVKITYNLLYYQVVSQIFCSLSNSERSQIKEDVQDQITSLQEALMLVNKSLGQIDLFMDDDDVVEGEKSTQINVIALEQQVQKLCLPFLRLSALLKHHIYNHPLPEIAKPENEFVRLVYYLELVGESINWDNFNAATSLNWSNETNIGIILPQTWCAQLAPFAGKNQIAARSFLVDQHITWHQPKLLQLPTEYDKFFTYYHARPCSKCHSVPTEAGVCLLCGTLVCMKQSCCKQRNVNESVVHSLECGAGTGIFLGVTSTYIIIIRGQRACLWGSPYLDAYAEEDRDIKRGKPLYLCAERYKLLEHQWLAHRLDHLKKTWVWHRDAL